MKPLRSKYWFVFLLLLPRLVLAIETHCPGQVVFNCRLENSQKIASLCVIESSDSQESYLQYRMGRLGSPEFIFPKTDYPGKDQFEYWSVHGRHVVENSIDFRTRRATYEIGTSWLPEFNDLGERVRDPGSGPTSFIRVEEGVKKLTFHCAEAVPLEVPILRNVRDMMKDRQ